MLKEEKRLLLQQLKLVRKGDDVPLLLPPSLEADLTDLSEEELEGRLASLKNVSASTPQVPRKRSESRELTPMQLKCNIIFKLSVV